MAKCSPCLFPTSSSFFFFFFLLWCYTSVTLAQFHCIWMTEPSICLNERGCRDTGWFDVTQQRMHHWLLFTVFMSDMQTWSSMLLLPLFFPRTLRNSAIISQWHITSSSIILSTVDWKAFNNFVHFAEFTFLNFHQKFAWMWTPNPFCWEENHLSFLHLFDGYECE